MARYDCTRCGATCHTTEAAHLCKDLAARLKRQTAAVEIVLAILDRHHDGTDNLDEAARIVTALAGRQLD